MTRNTGIQYTGIAIPMSKGTSDSTVDMHGGFRYTLTVSPTSGEDCCSALVAGCTQHGIPARQCQTACRTVIFPGQQTFQI
ncbi:hypothetical protein TNCV_1087761 [Trichonephila clavipes]|uniref:Uncharacterized protein n=1 Tax=Trichonephila clavipes TaxID=2585209 RepID=A0A8X6T246_TRICX|nr:hypothetical protein TNCV_1087761 [Trichonephila clavipes]